MGFGLLNKFYDAHERRPWGDPLQNELIFYLDYLEHIIQMIFCIFFIKLIWLGVGFLNRTGEEIGANESRNQIRSDQK